MAWCRTCERETVRERARGTKIGAVVFPKKGRDYTKKLDLPCRCSGSRTSRRLRTNIAPAQRRFCENIAPVVLTLAENELTLE